MQRPVIYLLELNSCSILNQLQIEEALLRVDHRNWCVINQNAPQAIVLGISGKVEDHVDLEKVYQKKTPLIRRFSGGGTVFIDHDCFMATFICNSQDLNVPCYPQPVFKWSEIFYKDVFKEIDFKLRENDYSIGEKKFGGNAQYMSKQRWLHHTSFLWNYNMANMDCLKIPQKMPDYRKKRSHADFLCKLSSYFKEKSELTNQFLSILNTYFEVRYLKLEDIKPLLEIEHRKATQLIEQKGC